MDPATGTYNRPFLTDALTLLPGYQRLQGIVFRREDRRFASCQSAEAAIAAALADPACLMVNRNAGSGTRILIDRLLGGVRPPGHAYQAKSHNGVAIAVAQRRADWGVAIETVARQYRLGFIPLQAEHMISSFRAPGWSAPPCAASSRCCKTPRFASDLMPWASAARRAVSKPSAGGAGLKPGRNRVPEAQKQGWLRLAACLRTGLDQGRAP